MSRLEVAPLTYEADIQTAGKVLGVHVYPDPGQIHATETVSDEQDEAAWAAVYRAVSEVAERMGFGIARQGRDAVLPETRREWLDEGMVVLERSECDFGCYWVAVSQDGHFQVMCPGDDDYSEASVSDVAEAIHRALQGLEVQS